MDPGGTDLVLTRVALLDKLQVLIEYRFPQKCPGHLDPWER